MASRQLAALALSENEQAELRSLAARRNTAQALALRARIVLACAEGVQNKQVAARLQVDRATVGKWRRRFVEHGLDGLRDEPRSGAPRTIEDARIEAVIVRTLESLPPDATHWSSRGMSPGLRAVGFHGTADLARLRLAAASPGNVQALHRP
jgi:transposase-like protein